MATGTVVQTPVASPNATQVEITQDGAAGGEASKARKVMVFKDASGTPATKADANPADTIDPKAKANAARRGSNRYMIRPAQNRHGLELESRPRKEKDKLGGKAQGSS